MNSKNMNYIFNVEYFDGIDCMDAKKDSDELKKRNDEITKLEFEHFKNFTEWKNIPGYVDFSLYSTYPGILVGTGNPHSIAVKNAIKCGFSFDYVTGLPYIPGSSLKGIIRSLFPEELSQKEKNDEERGVNKEFIEQKKLINNQKTLMIKEIINSVEENSPNVSDVFKIIKSLFGESNKEKDSSINIVTAIRNSIFENGDVFLGAYPVIKDGDALMEMDYITPHKDPLDNPNPINIIKVKPNVEFRFCFIAKDYFESREDSGDVFDEDIIKLVLDQRKIFIEYLFRELLLISGVGAKTNVGYGNLATKKIVETIKNTSKEQNTTNGKNKGLSSYSDSSPAPTMAGLFAGIKLDN